MKKQLLKELWENAKFQSEITLIWEKLFINFKKKENPGK